MAFRTAPFSNFPVSTSFSKRKINKHPNVTFHPIYKLAIADLDIDDC
jgi:hypothetical protein